MVGQTIGKYRIVSKLGRGGMGTVYRAIDQTLDREVAIKCLNPDLSDSETLKRFRTEALTLARLNHPNVAMLFELTEHEGDLLMVMEFLRGETYESLSQRSGPMPVDRSRDLIVQVLDALGHAHRAGVVHRDLKPANLMLTDAGITKVMDFGLARMLGTERLTVDGFMVGTPAYMAPEQVLSREIDGRADLYAVGVVFFRLLTSQLPFHAESGISMAHKQVHDLPTPVRRLRTELPPACEEIMARALAKAPEDRFQTAEEFREALDALGDSKSTSSIARPLPTASSHWPRPASMIVLAPEDPTIVMPSRRRRFPTGALFGVLLLAGIPASAFLIWNWRPARAGSELKAATLEPAPVPGSPSSSMTPPAPPVVAAAPDDSARKAAAPPPPRNPNVARDDSAAPATALPTISFAQVKLLVVGDKPHDRDVLVRFDADSLDLLEGANPVQMTRYRDIIGVFQSHSREPRWSEPDGTSVPIAKIGGRFGFFKGASDWVTVQTRSMFIPLHVPESEVSRMVDELEKRTGTKAIRAR